MKYWGYFLAKLLVAAAILRAIGYLLASIIPRNSAYQIQQRDPFAHDLKFTIAAMVYFLLTIGIIAVVVWDQRYRCRTCLRRLRMPITAGSWPNMFLIGQPRVEYICLYGHGTLKMPEVDLTGPKLPAWEPHTDMWRELEELHSDKR